MKQKVFKVYFNGIEFASEEITKKIILEILEN